jgi:hypothetical protein
MFWTLNYPEDFNHRRFKTAQFLHCVPYSLVTIRAEPFKDEAQAALFKNPVRTAQ